jgi:hypothetical protein
VAVDLERGTVEAEATFRGKRIIVRMKGFHTILGVERTRCMLYTLYATPGIFCTWCNAGVGVNS